MKNILLSTVMAFFLLPAVAGAQETNSSQPSGHPPIHSSPADQQTLQKLTEPDDKVYTQKELDAYVCAEAKKTETEMADTFKQIETKYGYDKIFITDLKKAQDAWIAYRNAQITALFPAQYTQHYGSMAKSCECDEVTAMTKERIKDLKKWIDVPKSGSGCIGTRTGGDKKADVKVDTEKSK